MLHPIVIFTLFRIDQMQMYPLRGKRGLVLAPDDNLHIPRHLDLPRLVRVDRLHLQICAHLASCRHWRNKPQPIKPIVDAKPQSGKRRQRLFGHDAK